jgi:predicted HicB family RNase H-like nuclease
MLEVTFKPYKGYQAVIRKIDVESNLIAGRVAGITRDMVTFYAATAGELQGAFEQAVDAYLESCVEDKVSPEKAVSGVFQVRISPDTHRELAVEADLRDGSINTVVSQVLDDYVRARRAERGQPVAVHPGVRSKT